MQQNTFHKFILPLENNLFDDLVKSVDFEAVMKGRKGVNFVDSSAAGVPIVRTTTKYEEPALNFTNKKRESL